MMGGNPLTVLIRKVLDVVYRTEGQSGWQGLVELAFRVSGSCSSASRWTPLVMMKPGPRSQDPSRSVERPDQSRSCED
jgi:hypothetical protein